ncbi:MAG: IclR family transcriptional regulator [Prosthecobacter sp.]|nr:IclR family transcriptional regulator [Prosthecobacter sp.]
MPPELVPYTAQPRSKTPRLPTAEAPALDRGLAILELLDTLPQGLTLTELSKAIGSPKNSTSRFVQTLIARDYLLREEDTQRFRLTGKLLRLGHPRMADVSLVECALEAMRSLRDAVGETVQLGIPIGDEGVIIEKIESTRAIRIGVNVGLRFPLHNNAPGKVLLAFQPPRSREKTIHRIPLKRCTERTITDKDALRKECEQVIRQGYSTDHGEADEGIHCVAAPLRDRLNGLVATIWVSGIAGRMPARQFPAVAAEVIKVAGEIERKLRA